MKYNTENTEKLNNIKSYIKQLSIRDKEIKSFNSSRAAKKRAEKKMKEEEEYQKLVITAREQVKADQILKSEIKKEIELNNIKINELEKQMNIYANEIGLTDLKIKVELLKEEMSKTIKTCCPHRNKILSHTEDFGYYRTYEYYECNDCGHIWKEADSGY